MDLKEYTVNYVKHKDLIRRSLKGFDIKEDRIDFHFKEGDHAYVIVPELQEGFSEIDGKKTIVCVYNMKNLDWIIKNWESLSSDKDLGFLFVDPAKNIRWGLKPYVHNLIADPETLEEGLKTMYSEAATK